MPMPVSSALVEPANAQHVVSQTLLGGPRLRSHLLCLLSGLVQWQTRFVHYRTVWFHAQLVDDRVWSMSMLVD